MRYYEFVAERDMSAVAAKLQAMIDHTETPEHERENAQRMLDKMVKPATAHKVGVDDLPNFGEPTTGKGTGTHKMGKDDLADFGTYTAKGARSKKQSRGQQQDFTV